VAVLQLHPEHGVRERFGYRAFEFDDVVFRHGGPVAWPLNTRPESRTFSHAGPPPRKAADECSAGKGGQRPFADGPGPGPDPTRLGHPPRHFREEARARPGLAAEAAQVRVAELGVEQRPKPLARAVRQPGE